MPTSIHAAGPTGQRSPGLDAAIAGYLAEHPPAGGEGGGASALDDLTDVDTTGQTTGDVLKFNGTTWVADAAAGGGGSGGTVTAGDSPAAPAEGVAASYLVTSAVTWPAGLVWSSDPDSGEAPTITDQALVTLFTIDGTTYAVMGATFGEPPPPLTDTTDPEWTATLTTGTPTPTTVPVTMSAAATDNADLTYEVSIDSGSTWATIVPSGLTFTISGLTPDTTYPAPQIRVKDSSNNMGPTLTAQGFTTLTSEEITLSSAILDLSPAGYWKLDETTGTTLADSSGNGRHGTTDGTGVTLAGQAGPAGTGSYALFTTAATTGVVVPDHDAWSVGVSGMTVVFLTRSAGADGNLRKPLLKGETGVWEWEIRRNSTVSGVLSTKLASPGNAAQQGEVTPSDTLTHNAWELVVVVIPDAARASRHTVYVSSATPIATTQDALSGTVAAYSNGSSPLYIGAVFGGAIGHVAIFPTALSGTDVESIVTAAQDEGWIA